jgi:alginate O-acetyltransferase complex protein AlgI
MALGLARILGIELPENFNFPYVAKTIQDFWRRWHMTLSLWFRDYIYIPLGGNRKGAFREYLHLVTVFILCGLWHGASLNFLFWGVFHGFFLVFERGVRACFDWKPPAFLLHSYTMITVMLGWVLFRAETMEQVLSLWENMFFISANPIIRAETLLLITQPHFYIFTILGFFFSVPLSGWLKGNLLKPLYPKLLKSEPIYFLLFFASIIFLCGEEYNPFIYFRF